MRISGAWSIEQLPDQYVLELLERGEDGKRRLVKFRLSPCRQITEADFTAYRGYHPRKMKALPLPEYMLKLYGLEGADEPLDETLHLRVSVQDKRRLEEEARARGETLTDYLRYRVFGRTELDEGGDNAKIV